MAIVVAATLAILFTVTQAVSASQGDQCDKPLSERIGGWFCAGPVAQTGVPR
jgi:hypothetical protein